MIPLSLYEMGVKGLYTYLRKYRRNISTQTIPSTPLLRIGVDAMSMLYKYKSAYADMYANLKEMKDNGHIIIFVFDGEAPVEKEAAVKERRDARQGATDQATVLKEHLSMAIISDKERKILEYSVERLEFQGWHMSREIRHEFQNELSKMSIPFIKAIHEADDVLIDLAAAGKLDVIVSADMDFVISGAKRLWIPFRNSYDGFEEIVIDDVIDGEGIDRAALLDAGILCGVEPLRGHLNTTPSTAFAWMRYYKSIENLLNSSVQYKQLDSVRDPLVLESVRNHFKPHPWDSRIRSTNLEMYKSFLDTL